jgi:putative transport protein
VEYLKTSGASDEVLSEPVVGYSLAYPISVVGMILAIYFAQRIWRVDYHAERSAAGAATGEEPEGDEPVANRTIRVSNEHSGSLTVRELVASEQWDVVFGRLRRDGALTLANEATVLRPGDLVTVVGHPAELERVTGYLGEESREQLDLDRSALDYRRVFVSNPQVVGRKLRELNLPRRFGAVVTRVRRGDVEMIPHGETVLEPGDRVRVVTTRENIPVVSTYFGDSYRAVSEIDVLSFSLGIATGVLLGLVPIPLPGGVTVRLGLAGGPLIVALILGAVGRTGPILWHLPFGANMMLRQIGLIFFLTGIGTRAGYEFYTTLVSGGGFGLLLTAVAVVAFAAIATMWIGHRLMRIPMGTLSGILSGLQSQPATLAFALQQSGDERPNASYAIVFPFAIISKIILAQLIVVLLGG